MCEGTCSPSLLFELTNLDRNLGSSGVPDWDPAVGQEESWIAPAGDSVCS